jgi:MFS transporter, Spinster family, sphingosine-1-phosphate transporter
MASKRQLSPGWLLFVLTGLNLFNYLDRYVLSAVLPKIQEDLRLDDAQGGTLATAFMIGYFATSPFFGLLGDRLSRKWLIAVGIFVWSLGTVCSGLATGFIALVWFRVVVGVGEASYATISPSLISDSFNGPKRNTALTIFYVAIPVGAALGNFVGGQVAAHSTWRHAFIWAGAPGLLLALVLLPFADTPRDPAALKSPKPTWRDVLNLFRIPNYLLVVLGYTAYTFALGGFQHWGSSFLQRVHHVPVDRAGSFFLVSLAVSGLVATFLGGMAASALQRRTNAGYAIVLTVSVALAVPVAFAALSLRNTTAAMWVLAAAMFLLFLPTGPINTLILETVPAHLRASAMAASIFTIHLLGDMISPRIVGGVSISAGLGPAMLVLPAALVPATILWLVLAARMRQRPVVA